MKQIQSKSPWMLFPVWKRISGYAEKWFRKKGSWKCNQLWHVRLLSCDPPVLVVRDYVLKDDKSQLRELLQALVAKETVLLVQVTMRLRHEGFLKNLRLLLKNLKAGNPLLIVGFLTDTEQDCRLLREEGFSAEWVHHGCFVGSQKFYSKENAVKSFDAVYDLRVGSLESLRLLSSVENAGLISFSSPEEWSKSDLDQTYGQMDQAYWFNDLFLNDVPPLNENDFNDAANLALVGLDLSPEGDPSGPALHYLLAGLPVVATCGLSQEEGLFDPGLILEVTTTPEALKEGVEQLKNRKISPAAVREETLRRQDVQRLRLRDFAKNLIKEKMKTHFPCSFPSDQQSWQDRLVSKHGCKNVGSLLRKIHEGRL